MRIFRVRSGPDPPILQNFQSGPDLRIISLSPEPIWSVWSICASWQKHSYPPLGVSTCCIGALDVCASSTNLTICERAESAPTCVACMSSEPFKFIEPPITGEPGFFVTGIDSPSNANGKVGTMTDWVRNKKTDRSGLCKRARLAKHVAKLSAGTKKIK